MTERKWAFTIREPILRGLLLATGVLVVFNETGWALAIALLTVIWLLRTGR